MTMAPEQDGENGRTDPLAPADAEAAPEPAASTVLQAAVSVPQPVDTVPTTAAPAVHASIIGRARAIAVAALQAVA